MGSDPAGDLAVGIAGPDNPYWDDFKRFLEPARARGGLDTILAPDELLWGVCVAGKPVGAATTRLTVDDVSEVVLVGGCDHRLWIKRLDDAIADLSRASGATAMRAYGRRGWIKTLRVNGWRVIGERDGFVGYEKVLL